jgi:hypothetical protein
MALYIPHSILHLARLLYVRPETFGPYCVQHLVEWNIEERIVVEDRRGIRRKQLPDNEIIPKIERESTRSHCVDKSLWKR